MMNDKTVPGSIALVLLLLAILLAAVVSIGKDGSPVAAGPAYRRGSCEGCNVIMIVMDALRPDHLGCYGYPKGTSPNIDAFAASAIRFENMVASAPWTKPSVVSLLTGNYPRRYDLKGVLNGLPRNSVTLQEILAGRGYSTAAFVGNRLVYQDKHLMRTFDKTCCGRNQLRNAAGFQQFKPGSDVLTDEVVKYLEVPARSKRLLYVHYMDTHAPYYDPSAPYRPSEAKEKKEDLFPKGYDIDDYDNAIRFNDRQIGRLFDHLKRIGMWDDSIIVVTSDHGEAFGEHGRDKHFNALYDEEIMAPLLIGLPGAEPGVVGGVSGHVDVMPTLLAALGVPAPAGIDGIDLLSGTRECAFSEIRTDVHLVSARTREVKVIRRLNGPGSSCFDLVADPAESRDLADAHDARCGALEARMESFLSSVTAAGTAETIEPDDEELANLRALGYVE